MALDITERDGSLSRSRYYSGTRTLLHAASTSDAPCGPPTPDQLVPVAALCSAQGSRTRGPIPDLRGILVPSELVMTSLLHSEDKVHRIFYSFNLFPPGLPLLCCLQCPSSLHPCLSYSTASGSCFRARVRALAKPCPCPALISAPSLVT